MIELAKKFDILHSHFIDGNGIKTISKELSVSRNTVRNYLREFSAQKVSIVNGGDKSALLLAMSDAPTYNSIKRERTVVTDDVMKIIKTCLKENENKKTLGQSKLCMKSIDIYELLIEKEIKISYPSVNNYVRELTNAKKEAFIKQHYDFGEVCEFS